MVNEIIVKAVEAEVVQAAKKWYLSKTIWSNIVAGVVMLVQTKYGFVIPAEYQTIAVTAINLGLRIVTHQQVTL